MILNNRSRRGKLTFGNLFHHLKWSKCLLPINKRGGNHIDWCLGELYKLNLKTTYINICVVLTRISHKQINPFNYRNSRIHKSNSGLLITKKKV